MKFSATKIRYNLLSLIVLLFSFLNQANSQTYRNLIFEGAGIRGIAYVGVLKVLEEKHIIDSIQKVGGTSAGAIISTAVALGYTSEELEKLIFSTRFQKFNDGGVPLFGGIHRVRKKYGWYKGNEFCQYLEEMIAFKTGNKDITFSELPNNRFKDLYITGINLSKQQLVVFSKDHFPNMKIKDAVRISMSIPLYFQAIFIDSLGNIHEKQDSLTDVVVDGGIISNFPIQLFDKTELSKDIPKRIPNYETLGIRIDSEEQIDYDRKRKGLAPAHIYDFQSYMWAFYNFVLENLNRHDLTGDDWKRTISVSSGNISPRVKALSEKEKQQLIANGKSATESYFEPRKNEPYLLTNLLSGYFNTFIYYSFFFLNCEHIKTGIITMEKIKTLLSKLNSGNIPSFKELYGTETSVLQKQTKRYTDLINQFQATFKHEDALVFSSPGRTEIGGNHTDHNYGRVLAGAVNLDNIAVAAPNNSNIVRIESVGYPKFEVDLSKLSPDKAEFYTSGSLVRGISARLKELGYKIGGFDACIDGGVPKGSGLSSSASFEVLIGAIISHLFNEGKLDPIQNAIIGQYAENNFFGKPCGLMDQTACSVGGLVTIDFEDPSKPIVKKVNFDFVATGFALVITDTGGNHADLNDEYASLPTDMKAVAAELGKKVLRQVTLEQVVDIMPKIREKVGDRALLRAYHFQGDNARVVKQVEALEKNDFNSFLTMVTESGYSSYMYNQNIFPVNNVREQGVSLALALSEMVLKGAGAWRVHGGGFAGTIQAFVPQNLLDNYISTLEHIYGKGSCHKLFIRQKGSVKVDL